MAANARPGDIAPVGSASGQKPGKHRQDQGDDGKRQRRFSAAEGRPAHDNKSRHAPEWDRDGKRMNAGIGLRSRSSAALDQLERCTPVHDFMRVNPAIGTTQESGHVCLR